MKILRETLEVIPTARAWNRIHNVMEHAKTVSPEVEAFIEFLGTVQSPKQSFFQRIISVVQSKNKLSKQLILDYTRNLKDSFYTGAARCGMGGTVNTYADEYMIRALEKRGKLSWSGKAESVKTMSREGFVDATKRSLASIDHERINWEDLRVVKGTFNNNKVILKLDNNASKILARYRHSESVKKLGAAVNEIINGSFEVQSNTLIKILGCEGGNLSGLKVFISQPSMKKSTAVGKKYETFNFLPAPKYSDIFDLHDAVKSAAGVFN